MTNGNQNRNWNQNRNDLLDTLHDLIEINIKLTLVLQGKVKEKKEH